MRIEVSERFHDDRHGQVDDQHSSDGRDRPEDQADQRSGNHVTDTEGADRARRKPQSIDNRNHLNVRRVAQPFDVVHRRPGDHHRQKEEEYQKTQDTGRVRD